MSVPDPCNLTYCPADRPGGQASAQQASVPVCQLAASVRAPDRSVPAAWDSKLCDPTLHAMIHLHTQQ